MVEKTITIRKRAGVLTVDFNQVTLHKGRGDTVRWQTVPRNLNYLVCFGRRTPFKYRHYGKVRPRSGRIEVTPPVGRRMGFKYSIEVGDLLLDPVIIIRD